MDEAFPNIEISRNAWKREPVASRRRALSDWQCALAIMSKQWRWSALFASSVILIVTVVTFAMKPVYEAEGRLQIDPPGSEVFSLNTVGTGTDSEYITTEAQKLQTDDLALATIRALNLASNPEITDNMHSKPATVSGSGQTSPWENAAVRGFQSRLSVRRDPSSRLVGVTFASHDPRLSADVVNTLMKLEVQRNFEARSQAIAESSVWLSRQLDDIREKMEKATRALAAFGTKTGIADVDPNSNTYAEKMGDLNKQLVQAASDRIQFESFLARINDPDSLPQVRNNLVIQALMQKFAEASAQLAQARVIYGPNHVEVRKLQNQVNELRHQINAQRASIVSELWTNYRAAKAREALLNREVKGATTDLATLAQYNVLKKEAQADRDLYDALYAKIKEAGISAASKSSNIYIVTQARVLDHPTRPHRTMNILAGVLVGLIGGVALAFVKDRLEDRIYTAEDVRDWTGLPSIAVVPAIHVGHKQKTLQERDRSLHLQWPADRWLPGLVMENDESCADPDCFLLQRPNAPESEAVHALRTMLYLSRPEHPPQVVLITSPLPGEGKTTLVNNLAVALTKHGRTCLVDADLRKPMVSTRFKLAPGTGLEHYLQGSATLDQVAIPSDVRNLTIIPSLMATDSPIQLLSGGATNALITRLRVRFDFVVIDTPPILPYADGLALSTLVDGVILVGRAGQTPRGAITRSMELLDSVNSAPILTIVLNAANQRFDYRGYTYRSVAE